MCNIKNAVFYVYYLYYNLEEFLIHHEFKFRLCKVSNAISEKSGLTFKSFYVMTIKFRDAVIKWSIQIVEMKAIHARIGTLFKISSNYVTIKILLHHEFKFNVFNFSNANSQKSDLTFYSFFST